MDSSDGERNIFAGTISTLDWKTYMLVRPEYRKSGFYDTIYSYHKSHSGAFELAYDVGCGPGQVTSTLAKEFRRVLGTDPNEYIIGVAKKSSTDPNVDFEVCGAEDLVSKFPARVGTADMVTVAEAIPLMNTEAAMSAFAGLLKPGGTLAIWFYGGPIFASPGAEEGSPEVRGVQALFRQITDRSLDEFRPFKDSTWQQAWVKISAWLDNVAFDPAQFGDVRRVKWNTDRQLGFVDAESFGFDFEAHRVSRIGDDETVDDRGKDRTFWAQPGVDFAWAKGFIDAQIPRNKDYVTAEVKEMLDQLEGMMAGRTWDASWPAVLLLATKK